jgi:hypothetical protein
MAVRLKLSNVAYVVSLALCGLPLATHDASAQAQSAPTPPLAGPPTPEQVQPWGLPPPPPGIGPVSLFADIHDQPQGKFLEGGAFDKDGNFWFVAIGSGWVSYLTPDGKLVPGFNCDLRMLQFQRASHRARAGTTASSTSRRAIAASWSMTHRQRR